MSNKRWKPLDHYSSWRKISIGMWNSPGDPTIYGYETLVVEDLLRYLVAGVFILIGLLLLVTGWRARRMMGG